MRVLDTGITISSCFNCPMCHKTGLLGEWVCHNPAVTDSMERLVWIDDAPMPRDHLSIHCPLPVADDATRLRMSVDEIVGAVKVGFMVKPGSRESVDSFFDRLSNLSPAEQVTAMAVAIAIDKPGVTCSRTFVGWFNEHQDLIL